MYQSSVDPTLGVSVKAPAYFWPLRVIISGTISSVSGIKAFTSARVRNLLVPAVFGNGFVRVGLSAVGSTAALRPMVGCTLNCIICPTVALNSGVAGSASGSPAIPSG